MRVPLTVLLPMTLLPVAVQPSGDLPPPGRSPVYARRGAIATSQPLASAAGLQVLLEGGNAIDAAVAAVAVLSVVEPTMTGIGGDLFAIVYDAKTKRLYGLNASGRAPRRATPEEFARRGLTRVPERGPLGVTVPGAVDGWARLLERFGTIALARAVAPAIAYARDGFAVSPIIAEQWQGQADVLAKDAAAAETFLPGGRAPAAGEVFANPRLARTLELIARDGPDAFYRGPIARAIADDLARRGGLLDAEDLAAHRSDWVDPISTTYRGYEVFELPPNTQGATALEMLNILEGYDLRALGHNSAAYLHLLVEAKRIAFADRDAYLADSAAVPEPLLRRLVSKDYAAERRREIDPARARPSYAPARAPSEAAGAGDTVYLTAADGTGNVVSLIQSIYSEFGAGIVAGDTGIVLQNRGSMFRLAAGHPNRIAPGKRPLHTLVPAMVLKDGRPWLSFGVMGGDMQPQGHVQILANLIDFGMDIQRAAEAPRVRHFESGVAVEPGISPDVRRELERLGHKVIVRRGAHGGFQGILIDPRTGVLIAGSDPRKDGMAAGY
ncbi:MAG TPA: gamma-glutamyltransferase [Vicinamibacterales bacterium]|nr:gamma-glutamyltransferase [Vicinamibacterales bacterium]